MQHNSQILALYGVTFGAAYAVNRDTNVARRAALEAVFSLYPNIDKLAIPTDFNLVTLERPGS